jgi:hypothetical protein
MNPLMNKYVWFFFRLVAFTAIGIMAFGLLSCNVGGQSWRAKNVKTNNITIIEDLKRGFKAGDTISGTGTRFVLLEVVSK